MRMTFDRKTPKAEISLKLALAQAVRKHGKRHATGGRTKRLSAKKRRKMEYDNAQALKRVRSIKARTRQYWSGEADEL